MKVASETIFVSLGNWLVYVECQDDGNNLIPVHFPDIISALTPEKGRVQTPPNGLWQLYGISKFTYRQIQQEVNKQLVF